MPAGTFTRPPRRDSCVIAPKEATIPRTRNAYKHWVPNYGNFRGERPGKRAARRRAGKARTSWPPRRTAVVLMLRSVAGAARTSGAVTGTATALVPTTPSARNAIVGHRAQLWCRRRKSRAEETKSDAEEKKSEGHGRPRDRGLCEKIHLRSPFRVLIAELMDLIRGLVGEKTGEESITAG